MPRKLRRDAPGTWHHVSNRGVGHAPIFETEAEARYFLSRLARLVRKGSIELHAYSITSGSYQLLLRSLEGELPRAMRWCQELYSRWANRRRRREGSLFRGRYRSAVLDGSAHRIAVLRHIDCEARRALGTDGIVLSSSSIFRNGSRPGWLCSNLAEETVRQFAGTAAFAADDYRDAMHVEQPSGLRYFVERRLERTARGETDFLDEVLQYSQAELSTWLAEALVAGRQGSPDRILTSPHSITLLCGRERRLDPDRHLKLGRKRRPWWDILEAGLLRSLCGLSFDEIGARYDVSAQAARGRLAEHRKALAQVPEYVAAAARLARGALVLDHPLWSARSPRIVPNSKPADLHLATGQSGDERRDGGGASLDASPHLPRVRKAQGHF